MTYLRLRFDYSLAESLRQQPPNSYSYSHRNPLTGQVILGSDVGLVAAHSISTGVFSAGQLVVYNSDSETVNGLDRT